MLLGPGSGSSLSPRCSLAGVKPASPFCVGRMANWWPTEPPEASIKCALVLVVDRSSDQLSTAREREQRRTAQERPPTRVGAEGSARKGGEGRRPHGTRGPAGCGATEHAAPPWTPSTPSPREVTSPVHEAAATNRYLNGFDFICSCFATACHF